MLEARKERRHIYVHMKRCSIKNDNLKATADIITLSICETAVIHIKHCFKNYGVALAGVAQWTEPWSAN